MEPTPIIRLRYQQIYDAMQPAMERAWERWQDEKEYEDWNDYVEYLKRALAEVAPDATFNRAHKSPFRMSFTLDGLHYTLKISRGFYTVERI